MVLGIVAFIGGVVRGRVCARARREREETPNLSPLQPYDLRQGYPRAQPNKQKKPRRYLGRGQAAGAQSKAGRV